MAVHLCRWIKDQQPSQCSLTLAFILVILITNNQTGDTTVLVQMDNVWLTGR